MSDTPVNESEYMVDDAAVEGDDGSLVEDFLNNNSLEDMSAMIGMVLEFLTVRAHHGGPYYIMTQALDAMVVFVTGANVKELHDLLPEHYESWSGGDEVVEVEVPIVITARDTGDEQDGYAE